MELTPCMRSHALMKNRLHQSVDRPAIEEAFDQVKRIATFTSHQNIVGGGMTDEPSGTICPGSRCLTGPDAKSHLTDTEHPKIALPRFAPLSLVSKSPYCAFPRCQRVHKFLNMCQLDTSTSREDPLVPSGQQLTSTTCSSK
jgi:hypothetical protein